MRLVTLLVMLLVFFVCAETVPGSIREVESATCKVWCGGLVGSGTAIQTVGSEFVYVLTCRHATRYNGQPTKCEFFTGQEQQISVRGVVCARASKYDLALIEIPSNEFDGYLPYRMQLATSSPSKGKPIISNGYPRGRGPTAFQAVVAYYARSDSRLYWYGYGPEGGRSGSGIVNKGANELIGVLTHRVGWSGTGPKGAGRGESIANVYTFLGIPVPTALQNTPYTKVPDDLLEAVYVPCIDKGTSPYETQVGIFRKHICRPGDDCRRHGNNNNQGDSNNRLPNLPGWEEPGAPIIPDPENLEVPGVPELPVAPEVDPLVEEIKFLKQQVAELRQQLDNIQLTPGPPGARGPTGDTGATGNDGKAPEVSTVVAAAVRQLQAEYLLEVRFLDGHGREAQAIVIGWGEPLNIPATRLQTLIGGKVNSETSAPLGEPLRLRSSIVARGE